MPDFCTCGAELPPDARFCHKCGKPQREEVLPEEIPVQEPPAPPPPAPPVRLPISFRNPLALRVGFFTALLSLFLNLLLILACPFWLTAAGFLGVYLYHRRTGEVFTVRSGARMGWITGVLSFVLSSVPLVFVYVEQVTAPDYVAHMREQMGRFPFPPGFEEQMIASVQTPAGIITQVVILLVMLFVLFTLFPLLGGALGAKVLGKD
ncbi:MAG TPA: zinc ribbon domain-containing protein [Bryobacteraceae bacterium]|nr:zinc ribbon domain-containing protein [Bryobacteraceae bacterium]